MTKLLFQRNGSAISPGLLRVAPLSGDGCSEIEAFHELTDIFSPDMDWQHHFLIFGEMVYG
jgi:hypothetical protein